LAIFAAFVFLVLKDDACGGAVPAARARLTIHRE
jgi:hypothetical protein